MQVFFAASFYAVNASDVNKSSKYKAKAKAETRAVTLDVYKLLI